MKDRGKKSFDFINPKNDEINDDEILRELNALIFETKGSKKINAENSDDEINNELNQLILESEATKPRIQPPPISENVEVSRANSIEINPFVQTTIGIKSLDNETIGNETIGHEILITDHISNNRNSDNELELLFSYSNINNNLNNNINNYNITNLLTENKQLDKGLDEQLNRQQLDKQLNLGLDKQYSIELKNQLNRQQLNKKLDIQYDKQLNSNINSNLNSNLTNNEIIKQYDNKLKFNKELIDSDNILSDNINNEILEKIIKTDLNIIDKTDNNDKINPIVKNSIDLLNSNTIDTIGTIETVNPLNDSNFLNPQHVAFKTIKAAPAVGGLDNKPLNLSPKSDEADYETVLMKSIDYYKTLMNKSKSENNNSKVRRYQRMLTDFELALKNFKLKNNYNYHELVVAPGFPRLPENPFSAPKNNENSLNLSSNSKNSSNLSNSSNIDNNINSNIDSNIALKTPLNNDLKISSDKNIDKNNDEIQKLKNMALELKRAGDISGAKKILIKIHKLQNSQKNPPAEIPPQNLNALNLPPNVLSPQNSPIKLIPLLNTSYATIELTNLKNILNDYFSKISYSQIVESPSSENLQPLIKLEQNLATAIKNCINCPEVNQNSSINIVYQKRNIPKLIRNINMKVEKVNFKISQIIDLNDIAEITNGTLIFVSVIIPLNKDIPINLYSNQFKFHPGCISCDLDFNFSLDLSNKVLIRQIKRTKIQINISLPGTLFRKAEQLAVGHVLFDCIYKYSKFSTFVPLSGCKKLRKSTTSGMNITFNIRDPICGIHIESQEFKWPFVVEANGNQLVSKLQFIDISKIRNLELLNFEISEMEKNINMLQHHGNECDLAIAKLTNFCLLMKRNLINKTLQISGVSGVKDYLQELIDDSKSESQKAEYYENLGQKDISDYFKCRKNSILKEIDIWKKNKNI